MSRPDDPRRRRRRLAAGIAAATVLAPFALTLILLGRQLSTQIDVATAERAGIEYMIPLIRLVGATSDVQSAAVLGEPVDTARLTEARAAVDTVDNRLGERLGTRQRWKDLAAEFDPALQAKQSGPDAYDRWSRILDLQLALVAAVGDGSRLVVDPGIDAYYVTDAIVARLPRMVVLAGRVADATAISGGAEHGAPGLRPAQQAAAARTETLRADYATASSALDRGLRVAFGSTRSRTLGPALLERLDRLRDASTAIAPPGSALGTEVGGVGLAATRAARVQVRDASVALTVAAAGELDDLVVSRLDGLELQADASRAAAATGVIGLGLALWILAGPRRRPDQEEPEPAVPDTSRSLDDGDDLVAVAEELLAGRRLQRAGRALANIRDAD